MSEKLPISDFYEVVDKLHTVEISPYMGHLRLFSRQERGRKREIG